MAPHAAFNKSHEFIGGPWDGMSGRPTADMVFYDPRGVAHMFARAKKADEDAGVVIGEYALDEAAAPPVWRWTRATDEED